MPLPESWRAEGPATVASLTRALQQLGVRRAGILLVHASLSSIGWVCGGETAVVEALLRVLGPEGTLVVPTMTPLNRDPAGWRPSVPEAWWPEIRRSLPAFDPAVTPSQEMGRVAEHVRCRPGALRSDHPQVSFAGLGPSAAAMVHDHDWTCHLGERSPLARLEQAGAEVLLLGVGFSRCSCFHLAEYRQPEPRMRSYSCVVVGHTTSPRSGHVSDRWFHYEDVDLNDEDFTKLGRAFEQSTDAVVHGRIGLAEARLFPVSAAVEFATGWMRQHRRR